MNQILLLSGVVIILSVFLHKLSMKMGVPVLLAFLLLGIVFGIDGVFKIHFENFELSGSACSFGLIFIMFSGGFGTNWKEAKFVAGEAILLSSIGVVFTALSVAAFCTLLLHMEFSWGLLLGSLIASTDAASVFSILRSRRLSLKDRTASLLEFESGSNDPMAYIMTLLSLELVQGTVKISEMLSMLFLQIVLGLLIGGVIAFFAIYMMKKVSVLTDGFELIFVLGAVLLSYALSTSLGGNGYLAVYLTGIILGNQKIKQKKEMVQFFDALTGIMQMLLFFLLGLLSTPSRLPGVAFNAIGIFLFLTFVGRPMVVFTLMHFFPASGNKKLLLSFAGLRGAASIVFAILAVDTVGRGDYIYHLIFLIVLLSILLQGSFLPKVSEKLDMIDAEGDVMKTFTDYTEEKEVQFIEFQVPKGHSWAGEKIKDIRMPPETMVILLERDGKKDIPNGDTEILVGDRVVIASAKPALNSDLEIVELEVDNGSIYAEKRIAEIPRDDSERVMLIERGEEVLIPRGDTLIQVGDVLVMYRLKKG